jgi:hypothetical protein
MHIAILDGSTIVRTELIVRDDYRPEEAWVEAEPHWLAGGTVENGVYSPPEIASPIPDSVSARQFKMQLAIAGLRATVEAWIDQQDELTQIAYHNSGAFVRAEPMMQTGFTALGFTDEQIDAFFVAAAEL